MDPGEHPFVPGNGNAHPRAVVPQWGGGSVGVGFLVAGAHPCGEIQGLFQLMDW